MVICTKKGNHSIPIWVGPTPDGSEPAVHLWYTEGGGPWFRFCDNAQLNVASANNVPGTPYMRCRACLELYVIDATLPSQRLGHVLVTSPAQKPPVCYADFKVDTINYRVPMPKSERSDVASGPTHAVPMTMFARFYDATGPEKVRVVRDARIMASDPQGYRGRDYYLQLRNLLRQTHWQTDDIDTFEDALGYLIADTRHDKREHYDAIGRAYVDFWRRRQASCFEVPPSTVQIAGLSVRVSLEIGMKYSGNDLALKIWWNAPRPKKAFRQAAQFLTELASADWPAHWTPALWDVRREEILPPLRIPRDFAFAVEGQAMAFQQIWTSLGE